MPESDARSALTNKIVSRRSDRIESTIGKPLETTSWGGGGGGGGETHVSVYQCVRACVRE